jgi:N-acetylmuramoyl-L-alanine amidase
VTIRRILVASVVLALVALASAEAGLPTVVREGRAYIDAAAIAARLGAKLEGTPERIYLRPRGHVVVFTRGWARVEVDGKPVVLEASVRVEQNRWLVPEAFVRQVLPMVESQALTPVNAVQATQPPKPAEPALKAIESPRPPVARVVEPPRPAAAVATVVESAKVAPPQKSTEPPKSTSPGTTVIEVPKPGTTAAESPVPGAMVIEVPKPWTTAASAAEPPRPAAAPAVRVIEVPRGAAPPVAKVTEAPPETTAPVRVIEVPKTPAPVAKMPEPGKHAGPVATAAIKPAVPGATLEDVRLRSYPTFTRVVVETSALVGHRVEAVTPKELRIRLTSLSATHRIEAIRDGLIEAVQVEPVDRDAVLRISFAGTSLEPKTSTLSDPPRLLFDFRRAPEPSPRATASAPGPLRTLVLDAGHGGHDSGAVGPGGLMEKDLVLDVTRRVANLVEAHMPGIKVLLSRKGDYFVPLRERTSFANRERADLFVSIHANAHREAASEGVETYFLSSEATDNAARQVAAAENSVVQLERPSGRGSRTDAVKAILWDLAQSEFQQESSRLAEVVQDSMTQSLSIPNRGVKQAGFYVLGGAAMPAVLVEIGFVTNPKEERKLKESKYRDDMARAIFAGIAEYKQDLDRRASRAAAR